LVFLFLVDELLEEQVAVVLLAHVLYLQVAVFLHQVPVLVVDLLGDLGHGFEVVVEFLLLFLEVVGVLLLLLGLLPQLQLDVLQLPVQRLPNLRPLLPQLPGRVLLYHPDRLLYLGVDLVDGSHVFLVNHGACLILPHSFLLLLLLF
jgi:hypothetical protein